ncbi:unnamed protein product [Prorocentrum cordatum]|uniref:Mei2-like C-terminal RNA recognition motif domain-containing protein n=1 Tax=Prorocentrum cordatum TaxID=2364126 RepID=A0ABN9XN19_9DINO|nr:unnamed protein product [Polarella glacialis]
MADVRVIIRNTFFEFESSIDESFAASGCGTRRVQSCPPIRGKDKDHSILNKDGSDGSRLEHTKTRSDANRSLSLIILKDPAVVHEEPEDDVLSCCSIDHYSCWQSSHTPLVHADLTSKVGESLPAGKQSCQALVSPIARTPLSSKAGSFTPMGSNAAVFAPGCPQATGAFGRALSSPGQGPDPDIQPLATDNKRCTTLLLRNIPCGVTRDEFINAMNGEGFEGAYDFVYVPIDFKTHQSKGYAFVNLISEELAINFSSAFNGFTKWPIRCRKLCTVTWSCVQGFQANVDRYQHSFITTDHVPEHFKPVVFVGKSRAPFPKPT